MRPPKLKEATKLRVLLAVVAVSVASGLMAVGAGTPALAGTHHHSDGRPVLVKTGHVALQFCAGGAIEMRVHVPKLTFSASQAVTVTALVRNVCTSPCSYFGLPPQPALIPCSPAIGYTTCSNATTINMGECSAVSWQFFNAKGVDIWPGSGIVNCPDLVMKPLAVGGTFSAVGSWDQRGGTNNQLVPRGKYRMVIGKRISFTVSLR